MTSRIIGHVRSNMVGYLALIVAFTLAPASAYATHLVVRSSDIVDGQVKSVDIDANQVRSADVRDDSLLGGGLGAVDLGPDSVGASEVAPDALTAADLANNAVGSGEVVDNALTGVDINESTLAQVPSALLGGFGRTGAEGNCDPESETFVTCAADSGPWRSRRGPGTDPGADPGDFRVRRRQCFRPVQTRYEFSRRGSQHDDVVRHPQR